MKIFVRILAFLLLIGTTIIFILKVWVSIPISYKQLLALFIVGVVSMFWANLRGNESNQKNK